MASLRIAAPILRRLRVAALCAAALLFASFACRAQEDPGFTIHVYTNLIQIPVLIRSHDLYYVPKVDAAKLSITVDDGEPFHAVQVRPEGDDPLSIAILLDTTDTRNELLGDFSRSFVKTATHSLRPHDSVAFYSLNCNLIRESLFIPADPAELKIAADRAIEATKHRKTCDDPVHLRDALALMTSEITPQTGRRVILAITDGRDTASNHSVLGLFQLTTNAGVAIFGLSPARAINSVAGPMPALSNGPARGSRGGAASSQTLSPLESAAAVDDAFNQTCQNSGGLAESTTPDQLTESLRTVVKTLRERYVVEFPWPKTTPAGHHLIAISLAKSDAFIRASGLGFSIAAADVAADSTAVHSAGESTPPTSATKPITVP
jgi:hypothetical protein